MFCTKEEFMRLSSWTRSYLNRQIRDGRLKVARNGKIDLESALPLLDKAKKVGTSAHSAWVREKAKGERYITKLRELRYQREHGRIQQEIVEGVKAVLVIARDRFRGLPSKLAAEYGGPDPGRFERRVRVEIDQILHDMSGSREPFDPDAGFVPTPPLVGAPCCRVFNAAGKVVLIHWGQGDDGWLISINAGWHVAKEFFDRQGNAIEPPRVVDGQVIGAPDIVGGEFTGVLGERCRYAPGVGKWWKPEHPEVHPHPVEVFHEGAWIPAEQWHEWRKHAEKESGKRMYN